MWVGAGWVLWRGLPREVFDLPNTLYDLVTEKLFYYCKSFYKTSDLVSQFMMSLISQINNKITLITKRFTWFDHGRLGYVTLRFHHRLFWFSLTFHHRDISSFSSQLVRTGLQTAGELRAASFISPNLGCPPQAGLEWFVQSFVGHQIKQNSEQNRH